MIKNGRPSYPVTSTLFHELGHNTDENSREGIESKKRLQDASLGGGRFYEWTNTIFERLANGKDFYKKDNAMELSEAGYEALAPLGSMLACALGMSEIEFAKIKDKGKDFEEKLLDKMFPPTDNTDTPQGPEILKKVKKIFDSYELDSYHSLSKKRMNQNLLNEMYSECLGIMKKRIEIELQNGNIENQEEYKKYQMFFLKKMNFNFKSASKSNGFILSRNPLVNDIGFCTDRISRTDLKRISAQQVAMADFGFDNNTLGKYNTAITSKIEKQSFFEKLKFLSSQEIANSETNKKETNKKGTKPLEHSHDDN